ncbi:MAG: M23 family metallopeptidase [Epsilonproteobacteria bacterium]|nr:M23 family metallopeptidase [Campylobacterota bacterium]
MFSSPSFEREDPIIKSENHIYWNRKDPLKITISDNMGLKSYQVTISDGRNSVIVADELIREKSIKEKVIEVNYPSKTIDGTPLNPKATKFLVSVIATDRSNWGFFQGNSAKKDIVVNIDYHRPDVNILSNSYSITQGGSALVVFQVKDENLKDFYVKEGNKRYRVTPYKEEGYYASLIAWPFNQDHFSAKVVAEDFAGNKRVVNIPYYIVYKKYRTSWIRATDKFIDGKISDLAESNPQYAIITDRIEKLRAINEDMRRANEELIHELASKVTDTMISEWKIRTFYPLKNGKKVADFGDHRHYYYKSRDNKVSESYHLGLDMASTKMATIVSSNGGKVVFTENNGIYGNMPMVDHGLGLYTLYGHCSTILVQQDEIIGAGTPIAKTGMTGLALGDHLHFGVLVQGIEVRPEEWMDKRWIRNNIDNVFKEADKIIEGE